MINGKKTNGETGLCGAYYVMIDERHRESIEASQVGLGDCVLFN